MKRPLPRLSLLLICLFLLPLSGCFSARVDHEQLRAKGLSLDAPGYFSDKNIHEKFGHEWGKKGHPEIGLALAGGGTKASDFSIGVLQGLKEANIMGKVDIVSSVSGGSYAALWYYARSLENERSGDSNFFLDCLPRRYAPFLKDGSPGMLCPAPYNNYTGGKDRFRYQNYLRGFQDVFSTGPDSFNYDIFEKNDQTVTSTTTIGIESLFAAALNVVPNILFDWKLSLSPSRAAYAKGIARTYGATPPDCELDKGACDDGIRAEGDPAAATEIGFEDIKRLHLSGKVPMWIVNATAGEARTPWDFRDQQHPEFTVFEFTPYGSGSGMYGYDHPLDLDPYDAVMASAAFLDSQEKNVASPHLRNFAGALMILTTFNWGKSYVNRGHESSMGTTVIHHLLPFPLYYLHKFGGGPDSAYIHLSDGGMSEDLGAYALIRRGLSKIIISDHSYDRAGLMEDICRLKLTLRQNGLHLFIPGLKNLDLVCAPKEDQNGGKLHGYDIFNWQHPLLLGCVTSDFTDVTCSHKAKASDRNGYFANVFVIKPALGDVGLTKAIREAAKACSADDEGPECSKALSGCSFLPAGTAYLEPAEGTTAEDRNAWPFETHPPSCELVGFIATNAFRGIAIKDSDNCPHFPQYSTVTMTWRSSPWMYGASRELGRRYARQLGWFFGERGFSDERFNSAVRFQSEHPVQDEVTLPSWPLHGAKSGASGSCLDLQKRN